MSVAFLVVFIVSLVHGYLPFNLLRDVAFLAWEFEALPLHVLASDSANNINSVLDELLLLGLPWFLQDVGWNLGIEAGFHEEGTRPALTPNINYSMQGRFELVIGYL